MRTSRRKGAGNPPNAAISGSEKERMQQADSSAYQAALRLPPKAPSISEHHLRSGRSTASKEMHSMLDAKFIEAIQIISGRLEKAKIKWALVGSTNLALQGIDIIPHDLDILVRLDDLGKMPGIFSEYSPSQVTELKPIVSETWEVRANINGVTVQIFAENDSGVYVSKFLGFELVRLRIKSHEVPCFALAIESQAYVQTGRQSKADMINDFIKSRVGQ